MPPGITPARTISIARCSNRRMRRTVRYSSAESAMPAPGLPFPPPLGRRRLVADGREDAIPQLGPGGEREIDRLGALGPLGAVLAAQGGEHLRGPRVVPLAVGLDVAVQVVHERAERSDPLVHAGGLLEHVRDEVLAAKG